MAKSPWRRLISWYDQPAFCGQAGRRISTSSSSGSIAVVRKLWKNWSGFEDALAAGAAHDQVGVERGGNGGQLGGRVGVGQAAADGAAIADLRMADQRQGLGEQRVALLHQGRALGRALANHRPDGQAAIGRLDLADLVEGVDVDQVGGAGQAQVEQGHEALAAGEDLGLVAVLAEQRQRLGHALRGVVLERWWFHATSRRRQGTARRSPAGPVRFGQLRKCLKPSGRSVSANCDDPDAQVQR